MPHLPVCTRTRHAVPQPVQRRKAVTTEGANIHRGQRDNDDDDDDDDDDGGDHGDDGHIAQDRVVDLASSDICHLS